MRWTLHCLALTLVMIAGTWWIAWWMVPLAAAVYGASGWGARSAVQTATLAGAAAWGAILAYDAWVGPVTRLTHLFGTVFQMAGGTLVIVTVLFAALLALSAAWFARSVRGMLTPG